MNKKTPGTIQEYKKAVRKAIASTAEVRKYGDLRKLATWEAAYTDFCSPTGKNPLPLTGEASPLTSEASPLTGKTLPLTENTVEFKLSDRERELLFGQPVYKVTVEPRVTPGELRFKTVLATFTAHGSWSVEFLPLSFTCRSAQLNLRVHPEQWSVF